MTKLSPPTVLLAAAALAACASRPEGPSTTTVTSKDDACAVGPVAALDEADALSFDGGVGPLSASRAMAPALRPPKPQFTSTLLLPPQTPGDNVSDFTGCLSLAEATEASGARFPAPVVTRDPPPEEPVRVGPMGQGVVISHDLAHACCLQGEVLSELQGSQVLITERLTGTPCGCRCSSTLRTAVGLSPGEYTVILRVQEGEDVREVFKGPVSVTATR